MSANYITALTGLRGIAAWWVVFYHFREALSLPADSFLNLLLRNGHLAVDLFFVLSGFVVFISYGDRFSKVDSRSYSRFVLKRLARIYPLHLFVLLLFLLDPLAVYLFSSVKSLAAYDPLYYLASLFLVQNWGWFDVPIWNVPAWSISTELGAYLIFPFAAVFVKRYFNHAGWHVVCVFVLCIVFSLAFFLGGYTSIGAGIVEMGLFRCIVEFSVGLILGHYYFSKGWKGSFFYSYGIALALMLVFCSVVFDIPDYIFVVPVCVLIIAAFSGSNPQFGFVLSSRVFLYLGEISYSTYLIHYWIKGWIKFASDESDILHFFVYAVSVLLASHVLYRFVEVPGRLLHYKVFSD